MLESWSMKKLLVIVVLGFIFSSTSNAEVVEVCIAESKKQLSVTNKIHDANCKSVKRVGSIFGRAKIKTYDQIRGKYPSVNICYRPNYQTVFPVKIDKRSDYTVPTFEDCNQVFADAVTLKHISGNTFGYEKAQTNVVTAKEFYAKSKHINGSRTYEASNLTSQLGAKNDAIFKCKLQDENAKGNPDGCLIFFDGNKEVWKASVAAYEKGKTVVTKPEKKEPKQVVKKPQKKQKKEPKKKEIIVTPEIDRSLITIGSGSGFYINNKGYALTNNHVIDICAQSVAVIDGKETLFRVIATDKTNDVAVLKTDHKSRNYIKINEDGAKLGENVIAVGYPLAGRLSDSVKITRGIVSSLSGLDNNIGQIQIDAALQPGNSGGPVINESGDLVGIASAGLNKLLMAKEAKYIPENVNFAVASPIVVNILKSKKVKYTTQSMFSGSYSNTELAELGDSSTIQLFCRNTRTAYNRLKSSNKYSTVLLDLD